MNEPRTIIVTGKGGVGKTSVAAATAMRAAAGGLRTVVVSTDPAHSLSDSFGLALGQEPTTIAERLDGQEVRAQAEMERSWGAMRSWLARVLVNQGVDDLRAEELTVPPGMDELFALLEIRRHHRSGEYDLIVVDCAPTGETLRLLGFPEVARWWLQRVFPWNRRIAGAARPLARTLDLPMPDPGALDDLERFAERLVEINAILRDPARCTIRLVLNPDRMVIREAKRTYTYLCLYGYLTDAVIANRVLPEGAGSDYFAAWREEHVANLGEVRDGFAPAPVLECPWFEREVMGTEMLDRLGEELYEGLDPAAVLHDGASRSLTIDDGRALVRVPVPFADRSEVGLKQVGDELVITVGGERRTIILPTALAGRKPAGAKMRDGALEIDFEMSEET